MIVGDEELGQGQQVRNGGMASPEQPVSMNMNGFQHNDEKSIEPQSLQKRYVAWVQSLRQNPTESSDEMRTPTFTRELIAEFIGCFILILFGCGMNATATLFAANSGLFQVSVVWGFAVILAVWTVGSVSGAHINPAVSFALCLLRPEAFPAWKLVPYWIAQLVGCFFGAAIVYLMMGTSIQSFEDVNGLVRGELGSEWSASIFSMYYPNPGFRNNADLNWAYGHVSTAGSLGCEFLGTAILMFSILAMNDARNQMRLSPGAAAWGVGMVIMLLVALFGAINQAGYNPARDLGPRLLAACAGWGEMAFPGPKGGFWVYTIGPLLGAPFGGAIHDFVLMRGL